jgi:hypothetical protein
MKNVPIHTNSNSISPLRLLSLLLGEDKIARAGRMIKVFSMKFIFKTAAVTSRRALNLIGIAQFIHILTPCQGAIVLQIKALFTSDAFSTFALVSTLPLVPLARGEEGVPVKFYENAYALKKLIIKENKNKSGIYR